MSITSAGSTTLKICAFFSTQAFARYTVPDVKSQYDHISAAPIEY